MFSSLFTPLEIGHIRAKNRIVFSPAGTNFATVEGFVTRRTIEHYEERAKGGAGIVVIEGTAVDYLNRPSLRVPGAWDDGHIIGLKALAEAVKCQGSVAIVQLNHGGPKALYWLESDFYSPVSASNIPVGNKSPTPHKMTKDQIAATVERFVDASKRVMEAGFDGVELHCAHFYLLSSFLSPHLNKRDDDFGGSVANRCRIVVEIVRGIRERVGTRFLISCRINGFEPTEDGLTTRDAVANARVLEEAGVDLLNVSSVAKTSDERIGFTSLPSREMEEGCFVKYAEQIKREVKVPVIGVGKIKEPSFANSLIEQNRVDLVAMCRALIADPELPNKTMIGRTNSIVKCSECMRCINELHAGRNLACPMNPKLLPSH